MRGLDVRALAFGGGVCLAILVPPLLALRLALGDFADDSNLWLVALAIFSIASVVGGRVAAGIADQRELVHGAVAAAGAFLAAVVVGIMRRAITGDGILSVAVFVTTVFFALSAGSLGILGGLLARRRRAQKEVPA